MKTENLSTLKIHKLTQAQYDRELAAGNIDPNAIYLTPDEGIDLSIYVTGEQLNAKADVEHTHDIGDITDIQSIIDSTLEFANSYTDNAVAGKANVSHNHNDIYYTETEVDEKLATIEFPIDSVNGRTGTVVLTASDVDAAPSTHQQSAETITGGIFAGEVVANANGQAAGVSLLRNSKLVNTEINPTVEGEIVWMYE